MSDEFFDAMLSDFLDESGELLTSLNDNLLKLDDWVHSLEQGDDGQHDPELMNEMFRSAHSLKGLSAMLGLTDINTLTHKMENVFDAARNDKLRLNCEIVELVFQAVDRLSRMVDILSDPNADPVECEDVAEAIQKSLQDAGVDKEQGSQADIESAFSGALQDMLPAETPQVEPTPATVENLETSAESEEPAPAVDDAVVEEEDAPQASVTPAADLDQFAEIVDDDDVPTNYLEIFIDEADEVFDLLTNLLVDVSTTAGPAIVEALLVDAHRFKGSAASVGKHRAAKLAHYMEDILQDLRDQGRVLTGEVATEMLLCVDALRTHINGMKTGMMEKDSFNAVAHALRRVYEVETGVTDEVEPCDTETNEPTGEACEKSDIEPEGPAPEINEAKPATSEQPEPAGPPRDSTEELATMGKLMGSVQFSKDLPLVGMKARLIYEKLCQSGNVFYIQPSEELLEDAEDLQTLSFAISTDCSDEELRSRLDVSGVEAITVGPYRELSHPPADETSFAEVTPERQELKVETQIDQPISSTSTATKANSSPAANQTESAVPTASPSTKPGQPTATSAPVAKQPAAPKAAAKADAPQQQHAKPAETIRVDIDRLDHLMNLAGQLVINKARFSQIGESLKHLTTRKQSAQMVNNIGNFMRELEGDLAAKGNSQVDVEVVGSHLRRIQACMEVIERDLQDFSEARTGVANLLEAVHQLDRVSDGLQKSVMDTRMVPVGPLFSRFKRVIRDITRNNGKDIRLEIQGEKTELDKRMIDELGDPLVHMVRNAADHGIESPEDRQNAGKPSQGTVSLNAYHSGNSIIVQVIDDGKGLDVDVIRAKAIEKGILAAADSDRLTHHQILQLIWEPGFTTAKQVSDISGRGMGMDIVRSKIEELNGHVELDSKLGEGTTFTIKLPLTLAILPSLMAEIENEVFAMPIESVVEIVSMPRSDLSSVHGLLTADVRGRIVSVVDIFEIFDWARYEARSLDSRDEYTLVITCSEGREVALVVDELLGEEDIVIKSMSENYRNIEGIAGASILGDGRVSLILDVPTLIEMASHSKELEAVN